MSSTDGTDWADYNASLRGREVRSLCRALLDHAGPGHGRRALDLGCGTGTESGALVAAGWRVTAVDASPTTPDLVEETTGVTDARLSVVVRSFEQVAVLPTVHLVLASLSLPFQEPASFERLWQVLRGCLLPGGWIGLHLFGDRDSWAPDPTLTFHSREQARALLAGWEVARFEERELDGYAYTGPKHWHVFEVVARRPE